MKKMISIIVLTLISTSVFAARLPTEAEYKSIHDKIANASTISDVIALFQNDKISPFATWDDKVTSVSGHSDFAYTLVHFRFNPEKPIGLTSENIQLLKIFKMKGVELNNVISPFVNMTLAEIASRQCSLDALKALESLGADLSNNNAYWSMAFNRSFSAGLGTEMQKACSDTIVFMSEKNKIINLHNIDQIFYPDELNTRGAFTKGLAFDQLPKQSISVLGKQLNVSFSKKPDGDEPSDDWYENFEKFIGTANGQDQYPQHAIEWWNGLSTSDKAWACYYSSFDEGVQAFHSIGLTDEWLTTYSVGGLYIFTAFSKFMVYTFAPYCNSLK
jgi:hypothetical protein